MVGKNGKWNWMNKKKKILFNPKIVEKFFLKCEMFVRDDKSSIIAVEENKKKKKRKDERWTNHLLMIFTKLFTRIIPINYKVKHF